MPGAGRADGRALGERARSGADREDGQSGGDDRDQVLGPEAGVHRRNAGRLRGHRPAISSANRPAPTFPPEMTTPTRAPPASARPARSAAAALAPLGSVTSFMRSKRNAIASRISASDTVTIVSTT